jgi:pilus assembly protein CpaF
VKSLSLHRQFLGAAAELLPWMEDPAVTDLLINGAQSVFVERGGELERVVSPFTDRAGLMDFIERLLVPLGKRVDAARPYVDGRLADGSRFHIILPPLAAHGPLLSIRKSRAGAAAPLESFADKATLDWLRSAFGGGANILIAGGTGSGKTTLLSRLLDTVDGRERIVVVEETAEIRLEHPHAVFLEARAATPDGIGEVNLRTLIRNSLRMRPTRLVLGECRGDEAWDLLQAMNTGHAGSACTIHANSPLDALRRLETLVLCAGVPAPLSAVREWISSALQAVVFLERKAGERSITGILRVQGVEGDRYRIHPLAVPWPTELLPR